MLQLALLIIVGVSQLSVLLSGLAFYLVFEVLVNILREALQKLLLEDFVERDFSCPVDHDRPQLRRGSPLSLGSFDD